MRPGKAMNSTCKEVNQFAGSDLYLIFNYISLLTRGKRSLQISHTDTPWILYHALSCEFTILSYHFLSVSPATQPERASLPFSVITTPKVTIFPSLPGAIPFISAILEWLMTLIFTFKSIPA